MIKYAAVCTGPDDKATWLLARYLGDMPDFRYPMRALLSSDGREITIHAYERYVVFTSTQQVLPNARLAFFGELPTEYLGRTAPETIAEYFRTGFYLKSPYAFDRR